MKALDLNGGDAATHHMLGRWCFEVANVSWYARKIAALVFGEPPVSSFAEALDCFQKAEAISNGKWICNMYWLGKCLELIGSKEEALKWYEKIIVSDVLRDGGHLEEEDREAVELAREALQGLR